MEWSRKFMPTGDDTTQWMLVGDSAHYAALDEDEDSFDGNSYVWTNEDGVLDIFDFAGLGGGYCVQTARARACVMTETGKNNRDQIDLYIGSSWRGPQQIVPEGSDTGDAWEWFTFEWELPEPASVVGTQIKIIGEYVQWLRVGALYLQLHLVSRLTAGSNIFSQRVRAFDDGAVGTVSFERLDHPGGSWSTPTQPFGEGSNSPDIECLADGRLRCALIDSDGNLQRYQSFDDGESWGVI